MKQNRSGQRVKITGGMREFVGRTGTVVWKEGKMYRVRLDNPVDVPSVGMIRDDLWESSLLKRYRTT